MYKIIKHIMADILRNKVIFTLAIIGLYQFGANIQIAGAPEGWDRIVTRGALDGGKFIAFVMKGAKVVGATVVNDPYTDLGIVFQKDLLLPWRTALDNVLIQANTDVSNARVHSLEEMPAFTAGRAGGKMKTGLHVAGDGSPVTRLGYTAMKVFGLENASWGTQSNNTSKEIGEILV